MGVSVCVELVSEDLSGVGKEEVLKELSKRN